MNLKCMPSLISIYPAVLSVWVVAALKYSPLDARSDLPARCQAQEVMKVMNISKEVTK